MKKLIKIEAVLSSALLLLCSCGGSSDVKTADLLAAAVDSGAVFEELVEYSEDDLTTYYDIEKDLFDECAVKAAGNPAYADEVVVVKASSSDNAKKIEEKLDAHVESRKNTLQSYAPAEYDKLNNSDVKVKGNIVYLVVCDDEKAQKALEKLF